MGAYNIGTGIGILQNEEVSVIDYFKSIVCNPREYGKIKAAYYGAATKSCSTFLQVNSQSVISAKATIRAGACSKAIINGSRHTEKRYINRDQELLQLKESIDRAFIIKVLGELTAEILFKQSDFILKYGINLNRFNIYLWIVVANGSFDILEKVDTIVDNMHGKYEKQGVRISCITNEEFIGIEAPTDYHFLK